MVRSKAIYNKKNSKEKIKPVSNPIKMVSGLRTIGFLSRVIQPKRKTIANRDLMLAEKTGSNPSLVILINAWLIPSSPEKPTNEIAPTESILLFKQNSFLKLS